MSKEVELKKTLGLTGVTVNAMALIAPGAFLWLTYQLQAAQVDTSGKSTALDMFSGLVLALIIALLTAISYSKLATKYPNAGTGSSYYFAEHSFMADKRLSKFSRFTKCVVGWFSHLYYWVYPGVMVAMFAVLINYIFGQFGISLSIPVQIVIAVVIAALTGLVAYRGVSGSTVFSIVINVIQITTLVFISVLAIIYRVTNPEHVTFVHKNFSSIVMPHSFTGTLFQATIAILVLVGFESATALAAESKSIKHVSRGVILSLLIQGLIFYMFEYFATNGWLNMSYTIGNKHGMDAAAASGAPIGDMVQNLGNVLLGNSGFIVMILVSLTVALAVFGTTLACMNTGVRITYAMAKDKEMPTVLNALHVKHATPHMAVWIITIISAAIGAFGVISVTNLTAITLLSNIGTFLLYGMTNIIALVAFMKQPKRNILTTVIVPLLGFIANIGMLIAVVALGIIGGGATQAAALIAIIATVVWAVIGIAFILINSKKQDRKIFENKKAALD
ncbi:MAG: APC family permease [Bacillota bacterium]|nr:APC family permease [Bacillota bacterium]